MDAAEVKVFSAVARLRNVLGEFVIELKANREEVMLIVEENLDDIIAKVGNVVEEPKILAIQPRWNEGIANSPELEILLTRIAECGEFKFIKKDTIYYSELGAEVMFYAHHLENPEQNAGGFSGTSFDLTMEDGNKIKLVGPWSSRAGAINGLGLGPCIDATITDKPEVMADGHTFIAGHVTLKSVQDWLEEHGANLDWELTKETERGETTWIPKPREQE